ncbi:hypothetical protein Pst134EA_023049 [Puccinia striiformis f. sp. tritici]|uniref:hypothetical protein n=1 Tax=Puccinia striiformis f. sp. tritici TaxID=168172 RepID=UPI0020079A24|nr:hypothetical protein Pst134EA_023049 [Puccinia striiformis f. sp. tritici]KAH9455589.1 hypothetical protein Pst134EA_023049 [Puccinia striiformis f. sp. tritici]
MLPFATALDEFLDANNPLILVHNNGEDFDSPFSTREWRKTLSSAVDAYREMLQREQALAEEVMEMTSMDKMADLCPKCFGPQVTGKRPSESHYHVCMDANFQQRRHLSASVEIAEHLKTPSLFIEPHVVSEMENSMDSNQTSESAFCLACRIGVPSSTLLLTTPGVEVPGSSATKPAFLEWPAVTIRY